MIHGITVGPSRFRGEIEAVPSKSDAHRALIASALAAGESVLSDWGVSDDVWITRQALETLGLAQTHDDFTVTGGGSLRSGVTVHCGQSGSSLRFLIPLALGLGEGATFTGEGRLMQRPLSVYEALFVPKGIRWSLEEDRLTVSGHLTGGRYEMPGNVSSQFVTGLCFALPMLEEDSEVRFTTPLESASYVRMTLETLRRFGIEIHETEGGLDIPGGQQYRPSRYAIEGDWSYGAFWLAAGAMGGDVTVRGLKCPSLQGDRKVMEILRAMGAELTQEADLVRATGGELHGITVDLADVPDLAPALAVAACAAQGETRFIHAQRLRIKESDRLEAIAQMVRTLGGRISVAEDSFTVEAAGRLTGGDVATRNDHRMAMAGAVAAGIAEGDIHLDDRDCVAKSAPPFWDHFTALGGVCHE